MLRTTPALLPIFLLGCAGAGADSAPILGGDTCTAPTVGTWTFSGAAFGMGEETMDGDLALDSETCTFTLENWSMAMDDLPSGGALDGDAVQLDGLNSFWRTCVGTASDENTVSGTCSDDGSDWRMVVSDDGGSGPS